MMQPARERPGTAAQKGIGHRMQTALMGWVHQLGTLEYWEALLVGFEGLGPLVPILLAMVESFFPPLPLIAIVALNVAAHGGLLGFLYSWAGVALGGIIMFLFWRRLIKRFFWKVASRSPKLEKAQQWVNRFDTSSLFMLSLLPFTPTSFMHFAFGMSDFDEKRYLRAVLLGKGLMVAMMAVFGQSLVSSLKNPVYLVLAVLLWGGMYWVSKRFCRKHHLEKTKTFGDCGARGGAPVCLFFNKNALAGSRHSGRLGMRTIIFILLPVPAQGVPPAVG